MNHRQSFFPHPLRGHRLVVRFLATLGVVAGFAAGAADVPQGVTVLKDHSLIATRPPLEDGVEAFGAPSDNLMQGESSSGEAEASGLTSKIPAAADAALAGPVAAPLRKHAAKFHHKRRSRGAVRASYAATPSMIGDHFGGLSFGGDPETQSGGPITASVATGGGDRRFKVAENVSPIPRDRIFFNYHHFENALVDVNGVTRSLDRFTFGFEKTFFDGLVSFETRVPFSSALNSRQTFNDPNTTNVEFGNVAFALKANLISGTDWMLTGGTTLAVPTGDDFEVFFDDGFRDLLVENDAVHLSPYLGFVNRLNDRWFAQGFVQADFDLNGNDVFTGAGFQGILQDQNLLFLDVSIGRWLHHPPIAHSRLNAVAAIVELHYTTTLNDTDVVDGLKNPFNRMDILNATAALAFQFTAATLRVGTAAPLTDDEEKLFDAEIMVQLNRFF